MSSGIYSDIQAVRDPLYDSQVPFGAQVVHVNMITGGILYNAVAENYDGPCSVSDISIPDNQELLAVLPNKKEAHDLAFIAIKPYFGLTKVLVEATNRPITHEAFGDWL